MKMKNFILPVEGLVGVAFLVVLLVAAEGFAAFVIQDLAKVATSVTCTMKDGGHRQRVTQARLRRQGGIHEERQGHRQLRPEPRPAHLYDLQVGQCLLRAAKQEVTACNGQQGAWEDRIKRPLSHAPFFYKNFRYSCQF